MTVGQVAGATGFGRASASTTLSKSGEMANAERGYGHGKSPSVEQLSSAHARSNSGSTAAGL